MENERSELREFLEEVHKDAQISRIQATIEDINMRLDRIEKSRNPWPSLRCDLDENERKKL